MSAIYVIAIYGAAVSTAVAIYNAWKDVWMRRPRVYVDLFKLTIANAGKPVRIGLAIEVVNIGSVPVHAAGVGIPLDNEEWRHLGLHDHIRGEVLPGKLQPGDHTVYFTEMGRVGQASLSSGGHVRGFVIMSGRSKRRWYSKPIEISLEVNVRGRQRSSCSPAEAHEVIDSGGSLRTPCGRRA